MVLCRRIMVWDVGKSPHPAWTVRHVAEYLRVNERMVYPVVERGDLPAFKVGDASWRFRREHIDAWIERQQREHADWTTSRQQGKR